MSSTNDNIGFDQLPSVAASLLAEVRELKALVATLVEQKNGEFPKVWLSIDELCEYLPDHPSKATVYGWVCNREIPCYKVGRRLTFLKSEIDAWIGESYRQTAGQLISRGLDSNGHSKR